MTVRPPVARFCFLALSSCGIGLCLTADVDAAGKSGSGADRAESVAASDDPRLPRWMRGELYYDDAWMSLDEAARRAAGDPRLAEYRRRRALAIDTVNSHLRLARWATSKQLSDLAEVHWLHVLRLAPHHPTALGALEMRWVDGALITEAEAETLDQERRQFEKAAKAWRPRIKVMRRQLIDPDPNSQDVALAALEAIEDPAATPALVDELLPAAAQPRVTQRLRIALVDVLGRLDSPMALDVLLDLAASSDNELVRYAAVTHLRQKPWQAFVPRLLAELRLPVEGTVATLEQGNQLVTRYSYEQEGADGQVVERSYTRATDVAASKYSSTDVYHTRRVKEAYTIPERVVPGHRSSCGAYWVAEKVYPARHFPAVYRTDYVGTMYGRELPTYLAARSLAASRVQDSVASFGDELSQYNDRLALQNLQIAALLSEITGESIGASPNDWWAWWRNYVEQSPDLAVSPVNDRLQQAILAQQPRGLARGTYVWTIFGRQHIEEITIGDLVLSQDQETGELAYKPVLAAIATGVQEVIEVDLGESSLTCSPGQTFWSVGNGWRRASDLSAESLLHAVVGDRPTESLRETYALDVYQLVVKDFHTMFVGQEGLLTHDQSPVQPTRNVLPGTTALR